ncbi:rho-related GTP-binding protein RhoU [Lepeophtheirus salmonis]|uniref:Rho-related GTP-binding protein RhoU n=1 Tax=Lepeophtheirus salmonis TaxID=72036 RepID=D3PIX6_LEPSM|nr:rho-related GTP-binding protein RhoU-like [Lepeophtheirus salmonis]ADD38512.1 Rho-related GTP-binding protein RhoU [Lepeophtheirus salmonis]
MNGTSDPDSKRIKCVFLGDGAVGKTSLIVAYTTDGYTSEYVPTAIDTYDVVVRVDGVPLTFEMCDTPGQEDFDDLRPLVYPNTDVFILCFSVVSPTSFKNIKEKWIPELKKRSSRKTPVLLVGTQSDLREDVNTLLELNRNYEAPVTENEAKKMASALGCKGYVESSALTQKNLKEIFDEAITLGIKHNKKRTKKAKDKKFCVIL